MKKFKYVGPSDAVEVPLLGRTVQRGETVEVEDPAVSAGLEGQADWQHVVDKKRSQAAKKAATKRSDAPENDAQPSAEESPADTTNDGQEG